MNILSLNLARRDDLGKDYDLRIRQVAKALDAEKADIVCFQEVAFAEEESLADEINRYMKKPYRHVQSMMSKRCKIADVPLEDRATSMRKMFAKDKDAIFTDGQAILTDLPFVQSDNITLTQVAPDERGRIDRHTRIAQNVDFAGGIKISNVHFASNKNAYIQLDELLKKTSGRMIIGDFNLTHAQMQAHKDIWDEKYFDSTGFSQYVSFPADGVAYDHLLIPKTTPYRFVSIRTIDGISDHSAVIFEIRT